MRMKERTAPALSVDDVVYEAQRFRRLSGSEKERRYFEECQAVLSNEPANQSNRVAGLVSRISVLIALVAVAITMNLSEGIDLLVGTGIALGLSVIIVLLGAEMLIFCVVEARRRSQYIRASLLKIAFEKELNSKKRGLVKALFART